MNTSELDTVAAQMKLPRVIRFRSALIYVKRVAITTFVLVALAVCTDFVNGLLCTRVLSLLVAPVEILYIPAFGLLAAGTLLTCVKVIRARLKRRPVTAPVWRWQLATWLILGLVYFTNFDPRLSGLAIRARMKETTLINFCSRYRAGGDAAVANDPVMKWGVGFRPHLRATDRFVEISWGATLPRTWGIRISDQQRPLPEFAPGVDEAAMAATDRLTVFIGVW